MFVQEGQLAFTQKEVLRRTLQAVEMWPTQAAVSERTPVDDREVLSYAIHALDGQYLLALLYLSTQLLLMQHGD